MSELSNPIPERAPPRRKTFLEMIEKTKDSTRRDRSGHSFSMGSPEHSRGFSFITAVGEKTDDAVFEQAMPFALLKKYSEKCNEWFGFGWHKDSNNDANTVCEVRGQNALRSAPFHPATSAAAGCLVSRWRPASAVPPNFPRAESAPDNSLPACRVGTGLRRPWSARKPAPCSDRLPAGSCCGCCWSKPRKPPCAWIRSFAKSICIAAVKSRKRWPRWRRRASWPCDSTGCCVPTKGIQKSFASRAARGCAWSVKTRPRMLIGRSRIP